MRKLILLFSLAIGLFACEKYEDYEVETVGFTTVYFPTQKLERSVVSGEGLKIKLGAYLGGVKSNGIDRVVNFEIADSLLGSDYQLLPADYYTLSDENQITISAGQFLGMIDVRFDSSKVAADPLFNDFNYAIPLVITSTTADSILEGKNYAVFPIKMMNTFEGNFYQVGQIKKFFTTKHVLEDGIVVGDSLDYTKSPLRVLKTINTNTVSVDGIANYGGAGFSMNLTVNADNSVIIGAVDGAKIEVKPLNTSTWDPVRRIFHLSYQFNYGDRDVEVEEELIFRNRIRDGINEWRWEGFPGN